MKNLARNYQVTALSNGFKLVCPLVARDRFRCSICAQAEFEITPTSVITNYPSSSNTVVANFPNGLPARTLTRCPSCNSQIEINPLDAQPAIPDQAVSKPRRGRSNIDPISGKPYAGTLLRPPVNIPPSPDRFPAYEALSLDPTTFKPLLTAPEIKPNVFLCPSCQTNQFVASWLDQRPDLASFEVTCSSCSTLIRINRLNPAEKLFTAFGQSAESLFNAALAKAQANPEDDAPFRDPQAVTSFGLPASALIDQALSADPTFPSRTPSPRLDAILDAAFDQAQLPINPTPRPSTPLPRPGAIDPDIWSRLNPASQLALIRALSGNDDRFPPPPNSPPKTAPGPSSGRRKISL